MFITQSKYETNISTPLPTTVKTMISYLLKKVKILRYLMVFYLET